MDRKTLIITRTQAWQLGSHTKFVLQVKNPNLENADKEVNFALSKPLSSTWWGYGGKLKI